VRHLPTKDYKGLTVVLSNPSRFDLSATPKPRLLSGAAGNFFRYECLKGYVDEEECDIRTSDVKADLLPSTKGILLLGEKAFREWGGKYYSGYKLQEERGCPLVNGSYSIPTICSFFPQDCMDLQNYESRFNKESFDYGTDSEGVRKETEEETKRHGGATARENFRFFLKRDCKKLLAKIFPERARGLEKIVLENQLPGGFIPRLYPPSEEIIRVLKNAKNTGVYLDIETDFPLYQISCLGISMEDSPIVYVIPFHRYDFKPAYGDLAQILRELSLCLDRRRGNEIVIHNSQFDLLILAWKYRILFNPSIYDTMLAQHKCFVDIEKSLGHCSSIWTWEEYHKDEGIFNPHNQEQERQLWMYNAKDVYTMKLIRKGQETYAKTQPGLGSSIEATNRCCYPYLINTLFGINYSPESLNTMFEQNDRLITQYLRLLKILLGPKLCSEVMSGSKTHILGSPKQCVRYYHEIMGYPKVDRTPSGEPSLAADALYKLKLKKPDNISIDILLKLRERIKESGSLKFEAWLK